MTARLLPVGVFVCLFRETLEADRLYSDLWLEGEIGDLSRSANGHIYFSLRDDDGTLKCVLFRNQALRQHQLPRAGDQVAVHGGISLYPRSGAVQLVVDLVRPAGLGAATLEIEVLRQRLEAEGLFDIERKRALPSWPRAIGVVTSAYGAAWHDIQTVIARRYPLAKLVLSPALVQGFGAAESIVTALDALQSDGGADVIILARGGGANDDLSAFNDEQVVRAVFASRIPVVAGIGHATDRTLVEEAADAFAATPSSAAEICVPSIVELGNRVDALHSRLLWSMSARRAEAGFAAQAAARRLTALSPRAQVRDRGAVLTERAAELRRAGRSPLAAARARTATVGNLLAALDPAAVLQRGYAALLDPTTNQPVFSAEQARVASPIRVVLRDGALDATIEDAAIRPPEPREASTR
jgi:exodeoxyribonuclease VII large subunit